MYALFNRFSLQMTRAQAESASRPGVDAADDVAALRRVPAIRRQLAKLAPVAVAAELREYGAWTDEELADHDANLTRLVWSAAGSIMDELYAKR